MTEFKLQKITFTSLDTIEQVANKLRERLIEKGFVSVNYYYFISGYPPQCKWFKEAEERFVPGWTNLTGLYGEPNSRGWELKFPKVEVIDTKDYEELKDTQSTMNKEAISLINELMNSSIWLLKQVSGHSIWPESATKEHERRVEVLSYILTLIPKDAPKSKPWFKPYTPILQESIWDSLDPVAFPCGVRVKKIHSSGEDVVFADHRGDSYGVFIFPTSKFLKAFTPRKDI